MCPARPSLHWVPAVPGSPASAVLWLAPIPRHPSRRTSLPSFGGTTVCRLAMQTGSNTSLSARSSVGPRADSVTWRSRGLPGSWGILVCMPCSRDPGEARHTKTGKVRGGGLPEIQRRRPSRVILFSGLSDTAYTLAVYASQQGSPRCHARLASGWLPGLDRAGAVPAGLQ